MSTALARALANGLQGYLPADPAAEKRKLMLAPLAHVPFCFYCEIFTIPLGAKERCPECGMVYPRE